MAITATRIWVRRLAFVAIATATVALGSGGAVAAGLVEAVPATEAASVKGPPPSPFASRDRLVRLDYGYMESTVAPRGVDRARNRIALAPAETGVDIALFPDLSVTLDRISLKKADLGGFVWTGTIRGESGYALLIVSDDQITGQVQIGTRMFRISPVSGAVHRVSQIDPGSFPPEESIPAPAPRQPSAAPDSSGNEEAKTRIRVLVPYTRRAQAQSGHIVQDAKLAIANANLAAKNAGVNIQYRLAGTTLVRRYRERGFERDLNKLTAGRGPFARTRKLRDGRRADLVALLRKDSKQYCGLGWYIETPSKSTANYGFTVTAHGCVSNHSVTHEIGHNSGLEHDRYQLVNGEGRTNPPNSDYNFGYTNLGAEIMSVMAYHTECNDGGKSCARVPMFSSSTRTYEGDTLGIAQGKNNAADAARRLNETRKGVASYR